MKRTVQLLEFVQSRSALTVDRDKGIIRGVKLLGWESANGRTYLPEGVTADLYEGRPVNVNHTARPGDQRSAYDRFGRIVNARKTADGIYGDVEYLKSHPLAGPITEAAERMPDVFGMSHNADGQERREAGKSIIETVHRVHSVDIVADPATVAGLAESKGNVVKKTIKQLVEASKIKPAFRKRLLEFDDLMGTEMPETGADDAPDGRKLLAQAVGALIQSESQEDHDLAQKVAKLLKPDAAGEEEVTEGEGDAGDDDGKDKKTEEGRRGKSRGNLVEQLQLQLKIRDLCADEKVQPTKVERKGLDACKTLQEAKELVEEIKKTRSEGKTPPPAGQTVRSAPPGGQQHSTVLESRQTTQTPAPAANTDEARKARVQQLRSMR